MNEIIIASGNKGKVREFRQFFKAFDIEVKSLLDLQEELPEIIESGVTFEENAAIKAETISRVLKRAVLADDSGLVVDALDGKPGVYSARYAGEDKSDEDNYRKLLAEMENVPDENRTARFVCVLAISTPEEDTVFYKGYCEGKIAFEPSGENGFGYDPVFIPEGKQLTMAELSPEEKNKISHRKAAFKQLKNWEKIAKGK